MVEKRQIIRLLIISHKSPYAPIDGGVLAVRNFFEALCLDKEIEVEMVCLETNKHPHLPNKNTFENRIDAKYINTDLNKKDALLSLFKGESYNLNRFYSKGISREICDKIVENQYDFILFESLFSTVYLKDIKKIYKGKLLYRSHNVEHHIWEKLAKSTSFLPKKWYLNKLASDLKSYEEDIHGAFDAIFPISKVDVEYYKTCVDQKVDIRLLYFIRDQRDREEQLNTNHFFHLASMDWQPNLDAVDWFVNEVWKPLHNQRPDLTLHLAGKSMPKTYFEMDQFGIKAYDYVEDGDAFMQNHGTLLVPLFSGSGIRIKVVDALSLNVPFISTSLGVSGIDLESEKHYLNAETKADFKKQILRIVKKEVDCLEMVENSKIFAEQHFQSESVVQTFKNQLRKL
ncbi:MAG: glycosyltransferase [Flavobacteriales bacterium]